MKSLAADVGEVLKAHGLMLTTAESCTGGGIAEAVTEVSGSSTWFDRGFVTYSNQAKIDMLGVRETTLQLHGAVSEATVREMAAGALWHSQAQVSVAVSGIAGPTGGTPEKPVGTVWLAWCVQDGMCDARMLHFHGDRASVRMQATEAALRGVLQIVQQSRLSA